MTRSSVVEIILLLLALGAMAPSARAQGDEAGAAALPEADEPEYLPPALTEEVPAPPAEVDPSQASATPAGQWVYTSQYGWVWMPYGDSYTYLPTSGGVPNMYVYYPVVGWTWVIAPWVWGCGPMPYFGVYGWYGYGWYGYGYGHWYGYAGPYVGWAGAGYWYGGRWYGGYGYRVAPAPPRGAYAGRAGAAPAPARTAAPPASRAAPVPAGRASPAPRPAAAPPRAGSAPRAGYAPPRAAYPQGRRVYAPTPARFAAASRGTYATAPSRTYAAQRGTYAAAPHAMFGGARGGFAAPHGGFAGSRGGYAAPHGGGGVTRGGGGGARSGGGHR